MRRSYAALLCMVWLLGIEVLPNLHLATHGHSKTHTHTVDGTVITVSFEEDAPHRHADGTVHSHTPRRDAANALRAKRARTDFVLERMPDAHAAQGLAHHALALHAIVLPIIDARRIDIIATATIETQTGRDAVAFVAMRDARGPPPTT